MSQDNKVPNVYLQIKPQLARDIDVGLTRALRRLLRDLLIGFCFISFIGWLNGEFSKDTTDGAGRSGLKPHTDAATGCEYLSASGGSLTPRLKADGTQRGCRR